MRPTSLDDAPPRLGGVRIRASENAATMPLRVNAAKEAGLYASFEQARGSSKAWVARRTKRLGQLTAHLLCSVSDILLRRGIFACAEVDDVGDLRRVTRRSRK